MSRLSVRAVRRGLWLPLAVIVLLAMWIGWGAARGPRVPVAAARRQPLVQRVIANGRVWVPARVQLGTPAGGVVARLLVDEGSRVATGDTLLELANDEQRATAAEAAARLQRVRELERRASAEELRQAEVTLARAERLLARARELRAGGATAQEELDTAQEERDLADSRHASAAARTRANATGGAEERLAEASLAGARARLGLTRIIAPAAGTMIERRVAAGDVVQGGQILLVLAPTDSTWLTVEPEEKSLAYLRPGQEATASTDAFPRLTFRAVVARIAPAVDAQRGTVEVRLRVPEPPDYLRPDMTVSIDVEAARRDDALAVPAETVRDADSPAPWALVLRHGRVERRALVIGLRGAGMVEVIDGLAPGDLVVPSTATAVHAGQRARAGAGPAATGSGG